MLGAAVEASLEHLRPWMSWIRDEPLSDHDREQLIGSWSDDWEAGGSTFYGVFRDETVVGACGLHRRIGANGLEIGYWVHAGHVRHGYATELAAGLTTAAFNIDGIDRVEIHHDKANVRSGRIPEALGFESGPERQKDTQAPAEIGIDCTWSVSRTAWSKS